MWWGARARIAKVVSVYKCVHYDVCSNRVAKLYAPPNAVEHWRQFFLSIFLALLGALCIHMHHYWSRKTQFEMSLISTATMSQHYKSRSSQLHHHQCNSGQLKLQINKNNAVEVPRKTWYCSQTYKGLFSCNGAHPHMSLGCASAISPRFDLMCPSWCVLKLSGLDQIVCIGKCSKTDRYILLPNPVKRGKKTF